MRKNKSLENLGSLFCKYIFVYYIFCYYSFFAILYCGTKGLMAKLSVDQLPEFQDKFLSLLRAAHKEDVIAPLATKEKIDELLAQL